MEPSALSQFPSTSVLNLHTRLLPDPPHHFTNDTHRFFFLDVPIKRADEPSSAIIPAQLLNAVSDPRSDPLFPPFTAHRATPPLAR
jgi:hypothetical protein